MKILYLYQHFVLPEKSGITRTFEFSRRLCDMGHEVHLIASDESLLAIQKKPYTTIHSGINIHWLPIPYHNRMNFIKRVRAFLKYIFGAIRVGRRYQYDLVYVSSPPLTATLAGVFLSRIKKVPMVLEVRDLWPDLPIVFKALNSPFSQKLAKAIERFAYRSSSHLIVLSPGIRRAVITRGVPKENVTLIPNSCDIESFKNFAVENLKLPQGIKSEDKIVLYPGTLGIANGVSYIVLLANELKETHPEIKFLLVGDGKEKQNTLNLATKLEVLDHNLFLMDPIPKKDIPALFNRSSLVLNTLVNHKALWNSSPNKFFDALSASRPIAINFKGWLAELIRDYDIGLVLNAENIKTAANQISEALSDPMWIKKAGENAFQLGIKEFDRNMLSIRLHETLQQTIQQTIGFRPLLKSSRGRGFVKPPPSRSYSHRLKSDKLKCRHGNRPY